VWACLLRPEVLKRAIPGCQEVTEQQEGVLEIRLAVAAGPVTGVFEGRLGLEQCVPPEHCRLAAAAAGPMGAVEGWAEIDLRGAPAGGTELRYSAELRGSGTLAVLGDRMLERLFRRSLDDFFRNLGTTCSGAL
jgi:carbon monoxide dehydrogenase subunit G